MVRRLTLMTAGLAAVTILGLAGTASAETPALHVKSGGVWTAEVKHAGCEIVTFGAHKTFTGDMGGDTGTYTGGGQSISMKWTAGEAAGLTFSGTFSKSDDEFTGSYGGSGSGEKGQLVKGKVATWDGNAC